MRICHEAPFDWNFLKIGTLRANDLRKNVPIVQVGRSVPVPSTPPVIRVVLLHTERILQRLTGFTVYRFGTPYRRSSDRKNQEFA